MKAYFMRVIAVSALSSLLRRVAPEGGAGRATRLGAGLLVLLVLLGPLAELDLVSSAQSLARRGLGDPLAAEQVARETDALYSALISQAAEAYILDKAEELDARLEATVETKVVDRLPVPWQVHLHGTVSRAAQAVLTDMIATELGIPEERQEW